MDDFTLLAHYRRTRRACWCASARKARMGAGQIGRLAGRGQYQDGENDNVLEEMYPPCPEYSSRLTENGYRTRRTDLSVRSTRYLSLCSLVTSSAPSTMRRAVI